MSRGIKVVSGCFRLITPGHMLLIKAALEYRKDLDLVVVIDSDASINTLKRTAGLDGNERSILLRAIPGVTAVYIFDDMPSAIRELLPKVWIKGIDRAGDMPGIDVQAVEDVGAELAFIGHYHGTTTTEIIERIRNS